MADVTVDARGLQCPMPLVKLSQAIAQITSGSSVELLSSDRGSRSDIPAWVSDMGYELVEQGESDGVFRFVVAVG